MKRIFLFPGQGSQAVGMGRKFYEQSQEAREIFRLADEVLGFNLSRLCFEGPEEELRLTCYTQPALLTVSYIAYRLLGLKPDLAAGHSLGEYSALVAAGSLDLAEALRLVYNRGRYMMEAVPPGQGSMAAVLGLNFNQVEEGIKSVGSGLVQVANWNAEDQVVIAGEKSAVEEALARLKPPRSVMLQVSGPFHTSLMKPAAERLKGDLERVEFRDPEFPIISNVTAGEVRSGTEARELLYRQITSPVLWYPSMQRLPELGVGQAIELGSGKVLTGLLKRIARQWPEAPALFNVEDMTSLENSRRALSA
ncbi:MAG: ACP S-malonyltransferase [Candidatus Saccharicenans sp.]|jgi:[acyl-carrier-protein] S-malonyltransferase|nr:ACP S-malonyltransferase [Candidatus Saccharicenans sp.]MDH7575229.1 ACP S-malonyltransferase [Candidatus Saccharicenans sp.]